MNQGYWYNFKKEEYEYIETPVDFSDYLPQYDAAQALYRLYIETGDSPIQACVKVLERVVGK